MDESPETGNEARQLEKPLGVIGVGGVSLAVGVKPLRRKKKAVNINFVRPAHYTLQDEWNKRNGLRSPEETDALRKEMNELFHEYNKVENILKRQAKRSAYVASRLPVKSAVDVSCLEKGKPSHIWGSWDFPECMWEGSTCVMCGHVLGSQPIKVRIFDYLIRKAINDQLK